MKKTTLLLAVFCLTSIMSALAFSAPGPRRETYAKKIGQSYSDGFFAGGFKEVTSVVLKDIRRAQSQGFERIVFDLHPEIGSQGMPYFQVELAPNEGRIVVSIWSNVQYDFDAAKIKKNFEKSAHVRKVNVLPRVEEGLSIIELILKTKSKAEAFYLLNPSRLILDLS